MTLILRQFTCQLHAYTTVRLVLLVSVTIKHSRRLLDVKNALVNAPFKKTIYVGQPEGFVRLGKEDQVYALRKALRATPGLAGDAPVAAQVSHEL